jgi:predicted RNA-binding protein with PUA-like domain
MEAPHLQRRFWLFSADPRHYHWDTLFVKGKEMWRGAGVRLQVLRLLRQMRRGDRILCYHGAPDRWVYALAEVTREAYPDPQDPEGKALVVDIRAIERLPRPVPLAEMRANPSLRRMKFLKNLRVTISSVAQEEYEEVLRMAGIVAVPGMPLP